MTIELTGTVIEKDLARIGEALAEGMSRLKYGSFSDRNPALGRMRTLVCGHRQREFSTQVCCNIKHTETIRDRQVDRSEGLVYVECKPRVSEFNTAKMVKKIRHRMRPGFGTKWGKEIYDTALILKEEAPRQFANLLLNGLAPFHDAPRNVELAELPSFSEKVVAAKHKGLSNRKRKLQQEARRRKFGLLRGVNG